MTKPTDEWYTPIEILDRVVMVMGSIDFDPTCSGDSPASGFAANYLTAEDDCLSTPWPVGSHSHVFLNPPYSAPKPFLDRLYQHMDTRPAMTAIVLVNAATSTVWGQKLLSRARRVCFASPRIRFVRPRTRKDHDLEPYGDPNWNLVQPPSPRYENMIVLLGGASDASLAAFERLFASTGVILRGGRP